MLYIEEHKMQTIKQVYLDLSDEEQIVKTSVLIPFRRLLVWEYCSKKMGIAEFIHLLLHKFEPAVLSKKLRLKRSIVPRRQKEGQHLLKISIEPKARDWAELGIMAISLGVTKCYLLDLLLRLYEKAFWGRTIYSVWEKFEIDMRWNPFVEECITTARRSVGVIIELFCQSNAAIYNREMEFG
jgi:hypothetical protein